MYDIDDESIAMAKASSKAKIAARRRAGREIAEYRSHNSSLQAARAKAKATARVMRAKAIRQERRDTQAETA